MSQSTTPSGMFDDIAGQVSLCYPNGNDLYSACTPVGKGLSYTKEYYYSRKYNHQKVQFVEATPKYLQVIFHSV
jgi:hypothetical protein